MDFTEFEPASMKKTVIDYFVPLKPYVCEREQGVRYIRNNPVTARLCQTPEEWQWGSALAGVEAV